MKKISIFSFLILLTFICNHFWQKNETTHLSKFSKSEKKELQLDSFQKVNPNKFESKSKTIIPIPNTTLAYVENNNLQEFKIVIPKGKHLFNEEKMKEIAEDGTVDVLTREPIDADKN